LQYLRLGDYLLLKDSCMGSPYDLMFLFLLIAYVRNCTRTILPSSVFEVKLLNVF